MNAIAVDPDRRPRVLRRTCFPEVNTTIVNHVTSVTRTGALLTPRSRRRAGPTGVNLIQGSEIPVQALAIDGNSTFDIGGVFSPATGKLRYRTSPSPTLRAS